MSEGILQQAADRSGPLQRTTGAGLFAPRKIAVNSPDAATHPYDLSTSSFFGTSQAISLAYTDRYVSMSCEASGVPTAFWWYWSDDPAGIVDKTATGNGVTVGAFCPAGIVQDERPTAQYLILQTATAAILHIWYSSGRF